MILLISESANCDAISVWVFNSIFVSYKCVWGGGVSRPTELQKLRSLLSPSLILMLEKYVHFRSRMVNANTVNSKFHLIRSFFEYLARILSFHV